MKTNYFKLLKSSLMVLFLCLAISSWGQTALISNNLRTEPLVTSWNPSNVNYESGGGGYARFTTINSSLTTPVFNANAYASVEVEMSIAKYGAGADGPITVLYSLNGGITWTNGGNSSVPSSATYGSSTVTINETSANMVIRFTRTNSPSEKRLRDVVISGSGVGSSDPIFTVIPETVPGFTAVTGSTDTQQIMVNGVNLEENITVTLSNDTHFSISPSSFTPTGGSVTDVPLIITYEPASVGVHTAIVTLSSAGAGEVVLDLSGAATLAAPVVTATTFVAATSFVTNWNALPGAESYELDVYQVEVEISNNPGNANWNFDTASPTSTPPGVTVSDLSQGNNNGTTPVITSTSASSGYTGASGTNNAGAAARTGALNTGASGSAYFQFTITPDPGASVTLTGIRFGTRSTGTGPQAYTLRSSLDNYASDITTGTISGTNWALKTNTGLSVSGTLDQVITFRLYGHNGAGSAGAGTANWRIDDLTLNMTISSSSSTNFYVLQNENIGNVTSYSVTGLNPETTYYYVVRSVAGGTPSANSNEIEVLTTSAVIWTEDSVWSNGSGPAANGSDNIVVEGILELTSANNYEVNNLEVNGILTIEGGASIDVNGSIINNAGEDYFTIEQGGNLIQIDDVANTGAITVQVEARTEWYGFNMFSSPVAGQSFTNFSNDNGGEVYTYNYPDGYAQVSGSFEEGQGYLFAAPYNGFPQGELTAFYGAFTGVPHNGEITVPVAASSFAALGNPYPSAIDADIFLAENSNVGTLYFWTNAHLYNYTGDIETSGYPGYNYATYTTVGGTGTSGDETFPAPDGAIQTGQGFIAGIAAGGSVSFNNTMRFANGGTFYKVMEQDKHRFWLNLSNESTMLNQILVGYMEGASQGVDTGIDGPMFDYAGSALYSLIENSDLNYTIQGRYPFIAADVVPLGFRASSAGTYTISLADFDGLFAEGQDIYLIDNLTDSLIDLKEADYTFVSNEGIFDNRFKVAYENSVLSIDNPAMDNNWTVYKQDGNFQIRAQGFEMKEVMVFDMLGRTLYQAQVGGTSHQLPQMEAGGVLIIKMISTDNNISTKKVIN